MSIIRPLPILRLLVAILTILLTVTVATPAKACTPIGRKLCIGEMCPANEIERDRVEHRIIYQQWLAERAHLRRLAREGLADPNRNYAQDLARALVPPVLAAVSTVDDCGLWLYDQYDYDSAGYLDDTAEFKAWLWRRARAHTGGQRWPDLTAQDIPESLLQSPVGRFAHSCNAEFRDRVASGLPRRLSTDSLRASWAVMMRAGAIRPYSETGFGSVPRLVRFVNDDRTGLLELHDRVYGGWFRHNDDPSPINSLNRARERGVRRDAWRFLQNNPDGQALLSALNAAIADARGDGSEGALCPQTWQTAMAGLVEALDEAERRRTPRPRPATAPAQPSTPAG